MIIKPKFDESVFVCPGAAIVGDVTLGKNVNVWYNAVLRGDDGAIKVGDNTNIQDCAVLHEETSPILSILRTPKRKAPPEATPKVP